MSDIKLFEEKQVRSHWDDVEGQWYFSIIDVIEVLTTSDRPRKYWADLKSKLKKEGSELSDQIGQLKMKASDGKSRATDVANTPQLLRIIQSIPSPKAEPFKQWLAKVGYERIQEITNPEQSVNRARENWQKLGRSTALAELSTRQIAETEESMGLKENASSGKKGGAIAKNARIALESKTGKSVITGENFLPTPKENKKLK
ncbi:Bro-N domain-containing protein [Pedobacter jeongneungensis]|uniref:BRO-N domain-containing protein n=1 Tax=Pedobacter jeongneungensis TaxID=947309 RepID=UPI000468AE01|nr:Bro-N domain-containing protein [Pedobacter jeongneungensis]